MGKFIATAGCAIALLQIPMKSVRTSEFFLFQKAEIKKWFVLIFIQVALIPEAEFEHILDISIAFVVSARIPVPTNTYVGLFLSM